MADQGVVLPALEWFRNTIGRTEQVLSWLKLAQEAGPSPQTDSGCESHTSRKGRKRRELIE